MTDPTTPAQAAAAFIQYTRDLNADRAMLRDWMGGTITGGPNADGRYPLTDFTGNTFLAACPALLEAIAVGRGGGGGSGVTPTPDPARIAISGIRTAGNLSANLAGVTAPGMTFKADPTADRIVNIDAGVQYQAFLGAGASLTESACYNLMTSLTAAQRAAILHEWLVANGQSVTRICLGDSDYCVDTPLVRAGSGSFRTYDDSGATDGSGFSIDKDLAYVVPVLLEARAANPDLVIIASPWTPPVAFKSAGATFTSGAMNESAVNLQAYAAYLVRALQVFAAHGVPIDFVTAQNEIGRLGDGSATNPFPACQWTVAGSTAFLGFFGAAIAAASPALTTEILAGDDSVATPYVADAFADPVAAGYVAGSAVHAYNGSLYNYPRHQGASIAKPWHMTEISSYSAVPAVSARYYASGLIMAALRSGASSITLWNAFLDPAGQPGIADVITPMVTITSSGALTRHVDYYLLSQITRVVKRGAVRIDSSTFAASTSYTATGSDLETVAFRNPDGSIAVLLWNGASKAQSVYLRDVVGGGAGTTITVPAGDFQSYVFRNSAKANVPDAPRINATYNNGVLFVSMKKDAPCDNGGAITGYDIYVGSAPGHAGTRIAAGVALPAPIALDAPTRLYVYAQAVNGAGNSANGNEVAATATVTTDLTLIQVAGANGSGTAPSVALASAASNASTVLVVYSGDTDLAGPSGATKLYAANDATGIFFAAWSVPGYILAGGTTFTGSGTPFGWQLAAYELANVDRIAMSTHGVASLFDAVAYWQPSEPPTGNHLRIVAAGWDAGGSGIATTSVGGGDQGVNGIVTDSTGAGGVTGNASYHGGIMFRLPANANGDDYLNVTAQVPFDRCAYAEFIVT